MQPVDSKTDMERQSMPRSEEPRNVLQIWADSDCADLMRCLRVEKAVLLKQVYILKREEKQTLLRRLV